MKYVLAVSGGGIRGILPGRLLQAMQESGAYPKFDMISGTSTGAILAIGLASGISAKDMLTLYTQHGGEVFQRRLASGFVDPKYDAGNLERLLQSVLGTRRLSGANPELLVPSYCIQFRTPYDDAGIMSGAGSWFFRSWLARVDPASDFPLWQVARATSAAPTYFPSANLDGGYFVDGGVFANNPSMCALAAAMNLWPDEEFKVLSLGTGSKVTAMNGPGSQSYGIAQWATDITTVCMDGSADAVSYQAKAILGDNFLSCDTPLTGVSDAFDDASPLNITNLSALADKFAAANLARVKQFLS